MEEENGLELNLGLSLGGSKSNPNQNPNRNSDAAPNPNNQNLNRNPDVTPNPNRNPNFNPDATPNPKRNPNFNPDTTPNPNPNRNPKPDEGSSTHNFTNLFQNPNHHQNHNSDSIMIDLTKSSRLSINTGDGSVGENDDVAESHETEGSNYNSDNKGGASASGVTMAPSVGQRVVPAQQVAFGYSSVQLPTLETNPVWLYSTRTGSKELDQDDERKSLGPIHPCPTPPPDHSSPPIPNTDTHISSQPPLNPNQPPQNPNPNPNPNTTPPIQRGLAPGTSFGGSGSCPDLPWVTATSPGGRAVSGVTYKHGRDQIRIVCACCGSHMSPDEFVKHAAS